VKIIIAGSRSISDYEVVRQAVIASGYWKEFGRRIEVVCGMAVHWKWDTDPAAGGVDRHGYDFAMRNDLGVHEFPADWKQYGKGRRVDSEQGDGRLRQGPRRPFAGRLGRGKHRDCGHGGLCEEYRLEHVLFQRVTDSFTGGWNEDRRLEEVACR
jgi:hypothetical protein